MSIHVFTLIMLLALITLIAEIHYNQLKFTFKEQKKVTLDLHIYDSKTNLRKEKKKKVILKGMASASYQKNVLAEASCMYYRNSDLGYKKATKETIDTRTYLLAI